MPVVHIVHAHSQLSSSSSESSTPQTSAEIKRTDLSSLAAVDGQAPLTVVSTTAVGHDDNNDGQMMKQAARGRAIDLSASGQPAIFVTAPPETVPAMAIGKSMKDLMDVSMDESDEAGSDSQEMHIKCAVVSFRTFFTSNCVCTSLLSRSGLRRPMRD